MGDMTALVSPLFDRSKEQLRQKGSFLPHAAVLTGSAEVQHISPDNDFESTDPAEIRAHLCQKLRAMDGKDILAAGIAEKVTEPIETETAINAIKVLFEHQRGLCVAVCLPFAKRPVIGGYWFRDIVSLLAKPEIRMWEGLLLEPPVDAPANAVE